MEEGLFQRQSVKSNRIIYTPSTFAKTSLFHLQEVGELQALQAHTCNREGLASYLFFVVTKGSGELFYNEKHYALDVGDCVFVNCQQYYSHTPSPSALWSLKWVHFFGPLMNSVYDKYLERGGHPVFHPENLNLYTSLIGEIFAIANSDDYIRDMRINETIASLLTLIMSESWHPENSNHNELKKQSLQNVKVYLDMNYQQRISLDQLAEHFYINKYYLTRVFKEQFGMTILSYLDHVRVTRAKQLLRFTDMTAEEIGREVGIEDPCYFNRVFKKVEGMAPGEYRKLW